MKISEEFLQFIWKNKIFNSQSLQTVSGEHIEVLNTGIQNFDAGPDFFNAKIKINKTTWAGNVEVHVKSSDWEKHNHTNNKAYDNVILQVVLEYDKPAFRSNNEIIPTVELKFNKSIFNNYKSLLENQLWIPCQDEISKIHDFLLSHWFTKLTVERLERKSQYILTKLQSNKNFWEETFYQQLAASFGTKSNANPFEWLAKSLQIQILAKHKNNLLQLEALLFGQAGFLNDSIDDEYYNSLKKEYNFLQKKYKLKPIEKHLWKFLRLRPLNFPTIRIAQFAKLIYKSSALFSRILEVKNINELQQLFDVETSVYWKSHYNFGKVTKVKTKKLGKSTINSIIINTVIPFYFVYGQQKDNQYFKNKAIKFLEQLPAERNSIITRWKQLSIKVDNAYISQALLQLKNEYCNQKKCLNCQLGNYILMK